MKASELTGVALDLAVAQCEGATNFRYDTVATYWVTLDGKDRALSEGWAQSFCPSTNWAQGGPIIAREGITLRCGLNGWDAELPEFNLLTHGESALIAAMRCYAASKQEVTL